MNTRKHQLRASAAMALATGLCTLSMAAAEAKNVVVSPRSRFQFGPFYNQFWRRSRDLYLHLHQ